MRYFVIDTETVGLSVPESPASGVVELAWLEVDTDLNILREHHTLVHPGCSISSGASKIHGILDEHVQHCPTLREALDLGDGPVTLIGHNVSFDYKFLGPWMGAHEVRTLCTLQLARRCVHHSANHKLGTLVNHLEIPEEKAHSALGDVRMTLGLLKVLLAMAKVGLEDCVVREMSDGLMHRMPFGKYKGKLILNLPNPYARWLAAQENLPPALKRSLDHFLNIKTL